MYQLASSVNEETYVFGAIQTELSLASKRNQPINVLVRYGSFKNKLLPLASLWWVYNKKWRQIGRVETSARWYLVDFLVL